MTKHNLPNLPKMFSLFYLISKKKVESSHYVNYSELEVNCAIVMMTEQICRLQDPAAFTQKETLQERLLLLLLLVFVVVYI